MGRTHVVLVPGFGGFDALGELEYYAGITPIFATCSKGHDATLHYFDNLPTAAVETRAKALRAYLAKRVDRREIRDDDRVVLVGHSTGGLDIRAVIESLDHGVESEKELLERITRVVFLSVPQHGTNIADWVASNRLIVDGGVRALRAVVGLHAPASVGDFIFEQLAKLTRGLPDIVEAGHDVGREVGARNSADPWIAAQGRQALADLEVWLDNMGHDFFAIRDLQSGRPRAPRAAAWSSIVTRSYATIGERPFDASHFEETGSLRSLAAVLKLAAASEAWPESDVTYRLCYAACSAGPFVAETQAVKWFGKRRPKTWNAGGDTYAPAAWENDGIVNTASMLWPDGADTRLVLADHGDIIGHLGRREAKARAGSLPRRYDAYDLLGSHSGFEATDLVEVWSDVFSFALGGG